MAARGCRDIIVFAVAGYGGVRNSKLLGKFANRLAPNKIKQFLARIGFGHEGDRSSVSGCDLLPAFLVALLTMGIRSSGKYIEKKRSILNAIKS
jgi:hypothetical protein